VAKDGCFCVGRAGGTPPSKIIRRAMSWNKQMGGHKTKKIRPTSRRMELMKKNRGRKDLRPHHSPLEFESSEWGRIRGHSSDPRAWRNRVQREREKISTGYGGGSLKLNFANKRENGKHKHSLRKNKVGGSKGSMVLNLKTGKEGPKDEKSETAPEESLFVPPSKTREDKG